MVAGSSGHESVAAAVGEEADAESADSSWEVVPEEENLRCNSTRFWKAAVWYALRLDKLHRRLTAQDAVLRLLAIRRGQLDEQFTAVLRERNELEHRHGAWEAGAGR